MLLPPLVITTDADGYPNIPAAAHNISIKGPVYINKQSMELDHIQHFQHFLEKQLPSQYFKIISQEENDPPDFWIERNEQKIGLELTMLVFEDLRQEVKFFDQIQKKILSKFENGQLAALHGIEVDMFFGDTQGNNRPTKIDDSTLEELVAQLNKLTRKPFDYYMDDELGEKFVTGQYQPYPLGEKGSIKNGYITWRVTAIGYINIRTDFGRVTGFEVSHTAKYYSKAYFFKRLSETINSKDVKKNENCELLISVGMRDLNGWMTTLEEEYSTLLLDEWKAKKITPTYLSKIFLDCWGMQRIYVLYDKDLP